MPNILAVRSISSSIPLLSPASRAPRTLRDEIEKFTTSLRTSKEEKLVRKVFDRVAADLARKLGRPELNRIKDGIRLFVAAGNSEFAEKYYADFPDSAAKDFHIIKLIGEKRKGLSNAERRITCINLQQIRRECDTKIQE